MSHQHLAHVEVCVLLYCGEAPASEPAAQECIISTRVDEVALEAYGTAGSVTDLTNVCGDTTAHSQLNTRGFKPHRSFMLKGMRMASKPSACICGVHDSGHERASSGADDAACTACMKQEHGEHLDALGNGLHIAGELVGPKPDTVWGGVFVLVPKPDALAIHFIK